ncbi:MAG: thiamine pyrophosphate-dependent dehydrogenase E1 component subunit alpha [Chloroflexi bacterium]|nr:thiamine pyrophosphate-dependent dehydrogenase E1 component subunit alpha [Chloroflexota bacterium]
MTLIRAFEERAIRLRSSGDIACSVHPCNGQEAIAVGARLALRDDDTVAATYRGHHWAIATGLPLDALMAEFLGRESGLNGGRAGAGLFLSIEHGFLGESGIVGATGPIATGAALAHQFEGRGRVSVASFGDGAMNQGAIHEAMCFAAVCDLPVIFMCENNGYAEFTDAAAMVRIPRLADRAASYGFPGIQIDGDDLEAVVAAVALAAKRARAGEGPTLIEAMTHRLGGHHTFDAQQYRPKGEQQSWAAADCIVRLRERLRDGGVGADRLSEIDREAEAMVDAAVGKAMAAPLSDPSTLLEHVYA